MGTPDREHSRRTGETLEKTLQATFTIPEIRDLIATALKRIVPLSPAQWNRAVRNFIVTLLGLFSHACIEMGEPDPLSGLSVQGKIRYFITGTRWEGNFAGFAVEMKKVIIDILERIVSGDKTKLATWSAEITRGVFSDDPERATAFIRLSLLAGGGRDLLTEVNSAVKIVLEKLHSSVEFKAAVELAEKRQKWGGGLADQRSKETWDHIRPTVMGRVRGKNLAIPGAHQIDQRRHKVWDEEEILAMETVFEELSNRVSRNPFKLIADVLNGKLTTSLVVAVENDLKDEIRHERAKKRDVRKRESLQGEEVTDQISVRKAFVLPSGDPLDLLAGKSARDELLRQLTEDEKTVITLIDEGFRKQEIARKLGKSRAWVSVKLKGAREKLKPFTKI